MEVGKKNIENRDPVTGRFVPRTNKDLTEIIECACGCGITFLKYDSTGRPRRFISGHNSWGNKHGLGYKHTEEWKLEASKRTSGKNNPAWIGGRVYNGDGYIWVHTPGHPNPSSKNYVFEHRLIMEKHLGRYLRSEESIHHINGIKDDNRIENLMIFSNDSEHAKFEKRGKIEHILKASRISAQKRRKKRNLIQCECGCGQLIENFDKRGRARRFVRGHNKGRKSND